MLTVSAAVLSQKWSLALKKLMPIITIVLFVAIISIIFISLSEKQKMTTVVEGNHAMTAIPIKPGHFHDIQCAMTIETQSHAAQAISPSGKTWFFDDIGCLVLWLNDKAFKDDAVLWTHTEDSGNWIDARKAWYVLGDTTPMGYGFGAREIKSDDAVDFDTMRLQMLRGENLTNPKIRKKVLGL